MLTQQLLDKLPSYHRNMFVTVRGMHVCFYSGLSVVCHDSSGGGGIAGDCDLVQLEEPPVSPSASAELQVSLLAFMTTHEGLEEQLLGIVARA